MSRALRRARAKLLARWYARLATMLVTTPIVCLNYGYVPLREGPTLAEITPLQEPMRHYLQLYAYVAGAMELAGKDVLEISCGYGGGADFINTGWRPQTYVGLDLIEAPLQAATRRFSSNGLSFVSGRADSVGLASAAFDAVISVEASHCYPSISRFLDEVHRLLRPGGKLVLADYRPASAMLELTRQFPQSGLELVEMVDITANVLMSLEETHAQRSRWIANYGPLWLRPFMGQLAGVRGSVVYRGFRSGRMVYRRFLLSRA
ncbi:MAG: class I SAM-dependent methyltransferase [Anaerolineales bacterium]